MKENLLLTQSPGKILESFSGSSNSSESACYAGDLGSIPGSGRSPGEGHGNPLQYSCIQKSMDRGAWQATYSPWGLKELDVTEWVTHPRVRKGVWNSQLKCTIHASCGFICLSQCPSYAADSCCVLFSSFQIWYRDQDPDPSHLDALAAWCRRLVFCPKLTSLLIPVPAQSWLSNARVSQEQAEKF